MPKRKRSYGKSSSRRTYKRRRRVFKARRKRRKGYITRLPRGLIAQKSYVKLAYAETVSFSPVAVGVLGNYTLRANSIYDPLQTGVGTSVPGITHMFEKYDHCTVVGAKLVVDFDCTDDNEVWICGVIPTDGSAIDSTIATSNGFRIARRAVYKHAKNSNGEQAPMRRLTYNLGIGKFFGNTKSIVGDSRFIHTSSGNPTEQVFFQLMFGRLDDGSTVTPLPSCKAHMRIQYSCVFTEPKEVILA